MCASLANAGLTIWRSVSLTSIGEIDAVEKEIDRLRRDELDEY